MSNKDNWEWVEVGYDVEVALANQYPISYIYVTCKDSQMLIDPHIDNKCLAIGRTYQSSLTPRSTNKSLAIDSSY